MKKTIILLFFTQLFPQTWKPYHVEELNKYKDYQFDYHIIDSLANNTPIQPTDRTTLTHEVIGYLPYWEYDQYPDFNYELLSQINFFSVELDQFGNIQNDHNWENLSLVEYAHDRNVKVKLCATLFGQSELTTLLSSSINRTNAIENLLNLVLLKNADGVAPALRIHDSIIKISNDIKPVDRNKLQLIQTPQCFKIDMIMPALKSHHKSTDEIGLLLKYNPNAKIEFTIGSAYNFKITSKDDLNLAESFASNLI